jgi:HSP20 family protein
MALVHWDPFRALHRRDDVFDDMFRELFRRADVEGGVIEPAAEVAETANEVTVRLELPGVEKEQIEVSVTDDALIVRGEVRKETEEKKKHYHRQEIRYGVFQRTVGLPAEVDAAKATAELKGGVLKITLPKSAQPRAHRVKVAVG